MKLKGCPFCGDKEAELTETKYSSMFKGMEEARVLCHKCGAKGPKGRSPSEAISRWERRNV